jgi:hypothetical protein
MQFLQELTEKHAVPHSLFLVDGTPWLQAALCELFIPVSYILQMDIGMPPNGCSKNLNDVPSSSQRTSAAQLQTQQERGYKHSHSSRINESEQRRSHDSLYLIFSDPGINRISF